MNLSLLGIPSEPIVKESPATPIILSVEEEELMKSSSLVDNPQQGEPPLIHITSNGDPQIQIGFWGPQDEDGNLATCSVTACWTRGQNAISFTHCELRFANGYVCSIHEYTLTSTGARQPGTVHCRPRELDTRNYFFQNITLKRDVHDVMFRLALSYAADKIPFNSAGMYMNFVWPFRWFPVEARGKAFFCSELIVNLLQQSGVPNTDHLHASTTSPNDLWNHLTTERKDVYVSYNRNTKSDEKLANLKRVELHTPIGNHNTFLLHNAPA